MGNLLKAHVKIRGIRPLLWHHFGENAIPLEKQEKSGVSGNNPEEWRGTVLVTKDGQLFVKPTYVFAAIRGGAKLEPKKRGNWMATVSATLQILNNQILIDRWFDGFPNGHAFDINTAPVPSKDFESPVFLDVTGVVNPATKGRNVRYRVGASVGWVSEFDLMWDKTMVDRNVMQAVVNNAGAYCGLGDGRGVGYGRFQTELFDIEQ